MSIEIININKKYGGFDALKDVTVTIPDGKLVALLGPSGCGKTTLLRVIAGLEAADSGQVVFDGEEATSLHVRERNVGFVFQHYALFRHMTVFDNVAFGLQVKPRRDRPTKEAIRGKVKELLQLIQLEHIANHYPAQLSGGQRQRVALARALAVQPKVLLLDEPFGALDAKVRVELRRWLRRLHDEIHVTSVFVTHDQDEALEVADQIVVMNRGQVEQSGTPDEVYDRPASPFVFDFLGKVNLFHGRVHNGLAQLGGMELASPEHAATPDSPAVGYVRSHDLLIERAPSGPASAAAEVTSVHVVGPLVRVALNLLDSATAVEAELPREIARQLNVAAGDKVFVRARKLTVFAGDYQI